MSSLWTSDEIAAATGGTASASFVVSGVTFDSREVQSGDLFVAMPGTVHDGHKFVDQAFASGAAGAIVSQPVSGPHVLVEDTFAALQALGRASVTGRRALRKGQDEIRLLGKSTQKSFATADDLSKFLEDIDDPRRAAGVWCRSGSMNNPRFKLRLEMYGKG